MKPSRKCTPAKWSKACYGLCKLTIMSEDSTPSTTRTSFWQNEDWLAVVGATGVISAVLMGWKPGFPALAWKSTADLATVFATGNLSSAALLTGAFILLSCVVLLPSLGRQVLRFALGAGVVFTLAWAALWLAAHAEIKALGLEYVIFALGLGLLWGHTLPLPSWLKQAVRTEFFIKIGIVILGAGMLWTDLMKAGIPGMIQAALVIPVVWYITLSISRRLKVDDEFGVMLSTAVSICGVSAAIAACGAIQGDKKKLSDTTSLVLLCAGPMMILMPWIVKWTGMSEAVGGAWLGGTLDTSGSVLAATETVGEVASKVGTVVKLSQNVLIGVAAFFISVWWTMRAKDGKPAAQAPTVGVIWERFPKFVLGFLAASLVFSFVLSPEVVKACDKPLKAMREVWFAAAFVSIGLETRLGDLARLGGGRPALAFLGGQVVNIFWTLLLAWVFFGLLA